VGKVRKVGRNYVTQCPSDAEAGQDRSGDNLAISIEDPRKYLCWAGCRKEMIRRAGGLALSPFAIRVRGGTCRTSKILWASGAHPAEASAATLE